MRRVRGNFDATALFGIQVTLRNVEIYRSACGDSPIVYRMLRVNQALARAVIRKPCRLEGSEIRFLRKFLQMKGEDFAKLIHVDRTTLSKWETGDDPVGDQSDRLIRAIALILGGWPKQEVEDAIRSFTDIKPTLRRLVIRIEPESLEYEYAGRNP